MFDYMLHLVYHSYKQVLLSTLGVRRVHELTSALICPRKYQVRHTLSSQVCTLTLHVPFSGMLATADDFINRPASLEDVQLTPIVYRRLGVRSVVCRIIFIRCPPPMRPLQLYLKTV